MLLDRLPTPLRDLVALVRATYDQWRDHRTIRLGAGLAYYGLFALVPLLSVSIALAGLFISTEDVQATLSDTFFELFGSDAEQISVAIANALDNTGMLTGLGVISILSLVLAASLLVLALQDAFNTIWERPVRHGFRHSILRRLLAFAVVLACGVVIIISVALTAVTSLIERIVPDVRVVQSLTDLVGAATSWVLGIAVIALLFRYLTDVRVPWPAALLGGAVTALLVAVGTVAIGYYLRRYASTSVVGATGSVFVLLLWMYYEAQIILVGAEFTRVLAAGPAEEFTETESDT